MLKAGDFKICLSSIEFSIFYQQPTPKYCPSCGHFLPTETLSEVASRYFRESYFRLSSLLLVLGVGSWVCYKLIMQRKKKKRKPYTSCVALTINDQIIANKMEKLFNLKSSSHAATARAAAAAAAAAAAVAYSTNLNHRKNHANVTSNLIDSHLLPTQNGTTPYTVVYEQSETEFDDDDDDEQDYDEITSDSDYANSLDRYLCKRSYSITSQSSVIGDGTIAKLDQLLHQIEDIKESVGEMNSDLFTVQTYDNRPLAITGDVSEEADLSRSHGSFNDTQQSESLVDKEEPQTPSLEWDSNDINFFSELNGYHDVSTARSTSSPNSQAIKASPPTSVALTTSTTATLIKQFPSGQNYDFSLINATLPSTTSSRDLISPFTNNHTNSSTMTSSGITSINGSLLSSPDQSERIRVESIHDLIKEARRLGLLNDLVKFLLQNANRDSAYFED